MKSPTIELPSNKKFGLFFSGLFLITSGYLYWVPNAEWAFFSFAMAIIFLAVSLLKDDLLLPLNWLWMRLGFLLGTIVSPIILGLIFFGLFFPMACVMRLGGRDELKLNRRDQKSYWVSRNDATQLGSFKNQF